MRQDWLTVEEYMQEFKRSKRWAYSDIRQPGFPAYRMPGGKAIRINRTELEKYLRDNILCNAS